MIEIDNGISEHVLFARNELTLVDFYAQWCSPCKIVMPMLESMEDEFPNVTFAKVDIDKAPDLASTFDIMSVPTVVLLRGEDEELSRGSGINGINEVIGKLRDMTEGDD